MLSSYPVACPHANCGWAGNLVPSLLRGGPDAEIASMHRAWFRCPRCQDDWEVRITNDRVTVLPVEQAPPFQAAAVPDPATPGPSPWQRVEKLIREIGGHFLPVPENVRDGEGGAARRLLDLQLLLEQLPAALKALSQNHEAQYELLASRTADLSGANAGLRKEIADSAQAKRRLGTEHTVARILAESSGLPNVAAMILQSICQGLGWGVGAFWVIDRNAQVLRCIDVWHAPMVDITEFERTSRQHACAPGVGLPGRIWASGGPVWLSDMTQEAFLPRAPVAAREGLHAAVGFPIRNTEFLGVMEFFSQEIRQPDKELLQMMTSIGRHIDQFIERLTAEEGLLQKETELRIAKKIQQRLVAKAAPALNGFDMAGVSHSAAETGGDYFEFFPLLDSCQGIVIADACGHGLGPALLVTETRAYLRAFALISEDISRILAFVNDRLVEDTGGDSFVTLFLARLDPRTCSFLYSSAGHPKGCILDHSGSVKAFLQSTGPPLGIIPDCDFPISPAIALEPGDLVLLFTDGVAEAHAPNDTVFGFQRASDIVRVYRRDTAAQIVHNLYHAVRAFSHSRPQVDDITAVVIKVQEVVPSDHAGWGFADQALSGDGPAPKRIQEIGVAPMTVPACSAFLRRNNDGVSEVPAAFFPREEPGATSIG
jgi:serine phosphatase RsbU (regulator of sigma subunit)